MPIDNSDPIAVESSRIIIRYGLDTEAEQVWSVELEGELTYIQAIGMLEVAKAELPTLFD